METAAKKKKRGFTPHLSQKGGVKLPVVLFRKKGAGFTAIELLVVIAIIGIVVSIILVSLAGARTRAKDARVISDLDQITVIAEIINSTEGNYASVLTNADINTLMADMTAQGAMNILRTGNANGYCVEAKMAGGKWGCVNSSGATVFDSVSATACANGAATNTSCEEEGSPPPPPPPPECPNFTCDPGEDCVSCPADCGTCYTCGLYGCETALGENCSNCSADCGTCYTCGLNGCESALGETCENCEADCGSCPLVCGQYGCQETLGETCESCQLDCGTCYTCGLYSCEELLGENCSNCQLDCGACPVCPNGICEEPDEDAGNCPADCWCGNGSCESYEECGQATECALDCCDADEVCVGTVCELEEP